MLKYFVNDTAFVRGGVIIVTMPSEGPTHGCGASGEVVEKLHAASLCSEHRYFGDSVPFNDSSTAAFEKYLSVEQNLADIAALIKHAKSLYPTASAVVVRGGSYAGASSAWMRRMYPTLVDAAIAQSPPVTAMYDFAAYDTSNLVALSSPDSRCAHAQARVAAALTKLLSRQPSKLLSVFGAPAEYATSPTGLVDFAYALGDSAASAIQYGRKELLCDALAPIWGGGQHGGDDTEDDTEPWVLARLFANYTRRAWGAAYFTGCFYNSSCMATATSGGTAQSARSWYWMKCAHLGYLQAAPQDGSLSTRPLQLTAKRLMEQCAYIFGASAPLLTPARVDAFNRKYGGGTIGGVGRVFVVDYSDDPWKMATSALAVQRRAWALSLEQPFMLLTCDGCGHCGAGVPREKEQAIERQALSYLASWGVAPARAAADTASPSPRAGNLRSEGGHAASGAVLEAHVST